MMIPNMAHPIFMLPILTMFTVSFPSALVGIHGTKESAGFDILGMVGPINVQLMEVRFCLVEVLIIVVAFFVVPFVQLR